MSEKDEISLMTSQFQEMVDQFFDLQCRYQAAIRLVQAKLEALDDEFQAQHSRNPIHSMQSRMKTIRSMMDKLERNHLEISIPSAVSNLQDIAGVRVICSYIQDIYTIYELLQRQDDIHIVKVRDYIREPKDNGYRSLHLVVEVPVYLAEGRVAVPVEIQIRTIAMDFWASLEHSLSYKTPETIPQDIADELLQTATDIAALDERMQHIHDEVEKRFGKTADRYRLHRALLAEKRQREKG
ncbi:MAG: GTP pyrophosphokinase family protein [Clostridia bacterium]|nr:GTP pyrophosphokinase family protein [Clostridia bacterium]